MNIRFTETAFAELADIHEYIAKHNPAAARAVVARIEQVITSIGEFPQMARPVDGSNIRVFPTPPFPFLIFYTAEHTEVIIRNIRYAGRNRSEK